MCSLFEAFTINFISIQLSNIFSLTYNTSIFLKTLKTVHFSQAIKQKTHIKKLLSNSKKSSYCKDQSKSTVLGHY